MNPTAASIALALAAAASSTAFQSPAATTRRSTSLNSLRDIASYADSRMESEFEQFDPRGAFGPSPRGGMRGPRDGMMGGGGGSAAGGGPMNQYDRRGAGMGGGMGQGMDRTYGHDGFDPHSAYGMNFEAQYGGYGPPAQDMRMDMGPGPMNGVNEDNTMGGFMYSSRNRGYGQGGGGGGPMMYEDYGMPMGGFEQGPPPMGMGMDMGMGMEYDQGYPGEYGGFEQGGDMSRMGP